MNSASAATTPRRSGTTTIFDAFGTNGLGSSLNVRNGYGGTPSRQHDRLLPAGQPGRLLRPGHGRLRPKAAPRRPSGALHRRPCRLRRGSVRRRRCVLRKRSIAPPRPLSPTGGSLHRSGRRDPEDLERRRLVGLRLHEADGLLRRGEAPTASRRQMCSVSGVIPFGQARNPRRLRPQQGRQHHGWRWRLGSNGRAVQGDAAVQPVQADRAVHDGSLPEATRTTPRVTLPGGAAGLTEPRRQLEGLRNRPSSLLLIARSPRASCHRELKGRLRAAFFMPAAGGLCGHSPLTGGRFCSHRRRAALAAFPFDAWRAFCSRSSPLHARLRPSPPRAGRPRDADGGLHRLHAVPVRRRSGHQHPRPGRDARSSASSCAADLGLDQPFPVQFARFVGNAVHGEFGLSLRQGRKVSSLIAERCRRRSSCRCWRR